MHDAEPSASKSEGDGAGTREAAGRRPLGFQLGAIHVDVSGRATHETEDTWDATWLSVRATCADGGARVAVPATVVTSWSFERFCAGLDVLAETGVGCAYLAAEAPNLAIRVDAQRADAPITARIELTEDCAGQGHWFAFTVDRTEVRAVIAGCRAILEVYPAHQLADHG